ncbi:aminoglycoside phosphotransferase family protein [Cellulomonas telluris]|uniref:aminoglycoside phosphotransferase family protein n=1 Tax=Cellulomonas telluris TaxID=2306636 RepID=UPI0010A7F51A|nr:aminoglycoside phosphotransferase family protein [Cellulomonas telluris]
MSADGSTPGGAATADGVPEHVRTAWRRHGIAPGAARFLGSGLDNVAVVVDGLVVRVAAQEDPGRRARAVAREAWLLRALGGVLPLPVPVPAVVAPQDGLLAYPLLPGRPALELLGAVDAAAVGAALGAFLSVLHRRPVARFAPRLGTDRTPAADALQEARALHPRLVGNLPAEHRGPVAAFLAEAPPAAPVHVVAHADLGAEHVLVDPGTGRVTGVVDWTDATVTDPARDLGLLLRDLGPAALEAALLHYGGGDHRALRERACFYARCGALEDLAYGLATGRQSYADKSLAALPWLFPAHGTRGGVRRAPSDGR